MAGLFHYQPFKFLFLLYFFTSLLFLKVPFWFIYYSRRANRPRHSWTTTRTVIIQFFRATIILPSKAGVIYKRDLTKEVPQSALKGFNARFVWIEGLQEADLIGEVKDLAEQTGVQPVRIPGYWSLKKGIEWLPEHEKAGENEQVVLHLHGGGYVVGSAHPSAVTANIPNGILKHSRIVWRAFAVDYRISSYAPFTIENPFPAALLDSIAAYKYLICTLGFLPQNIVVVGDSAGGNLALALTRYLLDNHIPHLPPPGRLALVSPWTDIINSRMDPTSSHVLNMASDIFPSFPKKGSDNYVIAAFLGSLDLTHASTNRYLSPTSIHVQKKQDGSPIFVNFPKTYVVGGDAEQGFDDIKALSSLLRADGVEVQSDFSPDAVHDFLMFTWHEPERSEVLDRMTSWIDDYGGLLPYTDDLVAAPI